MITIRHVHSLDQPTAKLIAGLTKAVDGLSKTVEKAAFENTMVAGRVIVSVEKLTAVIEEITKPQPIIVVAAGRTILFPNLTTGEDKMFTLPRDHADEPYVLAPVTVQDSEGDVAFTEEFVSSDPSVVQIIPADSASGTVHFGTNGIADLRRNVKVGSLIVFSEGAQFTLTPGTVTATGGGISFPNLAEDAPN